MVSKTYDNIQQGFLDHLLRNIDTYIYQFIYGIINYCITSKGNKMIAPLITHCRFDWEKCFENLIISKYPSETPQYVALPAINCCCSFDRLQYEYQTHKDSDFLCNL